MKYAATAREAIARGDKFYFTGKPCKHGHAAPRRTSNGGCSLCDTSGRPPKLVRIEGMRTCCTCKILKPNSEFAKRHRISRKGSKPSFTFRGPCRACEKAKTATAYWANPELRRAQARNFAARQIPTESKLRWRESKEKRASAKARGEKYFIVSFPCPYGHLSKRSVKTGNCYECSMEARDKWRKENAQKERLANAKRKQENRERANAEHKRWRQRYPEKARMAGSVRHKAFRFAMPKWVEKKAIKQIYKNRPPGFHVDHIVPLRGKNFCGLHVPWNLQYLPIKENLAKKNKLPDGL